MFFFISITEMIFVSYSVFALLFKRKYLWIHIFQRIIAILQLNSVAFLGT